MSISVPKHALRCVLLAGAALLVSSCEVPGSGWWTAEAESSFEPDAALEAVEESAYPMRGDEDFSPDDLAGRAREHYDALWEALRTDAARERMTAWADEDDLYAYGRYVQEHILALLTALRVTGDLALLDEVHRLAEVMRGHLDDSWRGPAAGDDEGDDGYLNWVWRGDSDTHAGRDVHETDEIRAHAMVAQFAWAFERNRDLESPAGADYGEAADFWKEYLTEHFEAKWRERNDVSWPEFPFLQRDYVHPTTNASKYHYYLYRLTGEEPYLEEAQRLSSLVFREFREVETEAGPALVWPRGLVHAGNDNGYLMPSTYVGYVIGDAVDLHLEGFDGWADPRVPRYLATTLGHLMEGPDAKEPLARDVGGGARQANLQASSGREWGPGTAAEFVRKSFPLLAPWSFDDTIDERARRAFEAVDEENRFPSAPVGLLLDATLEVREP